MVEGAGVDVDADADADTDADVDAAAVVAPVVVAVVVLVDAAVAEAAVAVVAVVVVLAVAVSLHRTPVGMFGTHCSAAPKTRMSVRWCASPFEMGFRLPSLARPCPSFLPMTLASWLHWLAG